MGYVTQDEVRRASETDLLTYLSRERPDELVDLGRGNYCTREHDSLKISNGKWYWFSRAVGGVSALDYLIKVEGIPFTAAVGMVNGVSSYTRTAGAQEERDVPFVPPEPAADSSAAAAYLRSRGISSTVIEELMEKGLIYQARRVRNVVFLGLDGQGTARFAAVRSMTGPFKGDSRGSDKRYSFRVRGDGEITEIHLFEAAIDLLSYLTLMEYRSESRDGKLFLSLSGVAGDRLPPALEQELEDEPGIRKAVLHLDRDDAGRRASHAIMEKLAGIMEVEDRPPGAGKDVNDMLRISMYGWRQDRREEHTGDER